MTKIFLKACMISACMLSVSPASARAEQGAPYATIGVERAQIDLSDVGTKSYNALALRAGIPLRGAWTAQGELLISGDDAPLDGATLQYKGAVGFAALRTFELGNGVSLYGKGGVRFTRLKLTGLSGPHIDPDPGFEFGVGANVALSDLAALRLDIGRIEGREADQNSIGLSLLRRF
jgi:opacity protein-like surface antigen